MINTRRIKLRLTDIFIYDVLIGISICMVLPFLWMLITSLKPADEVFHHPIILISARSSFDNYLFIIKKYNIGRIVLNTFFYAAGATILRLFFCSMAGFAFAKYAFPGRNMLFSFVLGTMIIPFTVMMVPLYIIMRKLNLIDSYIGLILPGIATAFGIFFMRQYISTISSELLDAARMDGAGEFSIFWRVILPIIAPGLTSIGLIFFMESWNEFLWPLVILKTPSNYTIPLTISSMVGVIGRPIYQAQMAASVISVVPLLIIFLVFQRRFLEGITAGAIKG